MMIKMFDNKKKYIWTNQFEYYKKIGCKYWISIHCKTLINLRNKMEWSTAPSYAAKNFKNTTD